MNEAPPDVGVPTKIPGPAEDAGVTPKEVLARVKVPANTKVPTEAEPPATPAGIEGPTIPTEDGTPAEIEAPPGEVPPGDIPPPLRAQPEGPGKSPTTPEAPATPTIYASCYNSLTNSSTCPASSTRGLPTRTPPTTGTDPRRRSTSPRLHLERRPPHLRQMCMIVRRRARYLKP